MKRYTLALTALATFAFADNYMSEAVQKGGTLSINADTAAPKQKKYEAESLPPMPPMASSSPVEIHQSASPAPKVTKMTHAQAKKAKKSSKLQKSKKAKKNIVFSNL